MSEIPQFTIRDPGGAIYGPADVALLRQWIGEGRITRAMEIAPRGTQAFVPIVQMPELAAAFSAEPPRPQRIGVPESYPQYASVQPRVSGVATASLVFGCLTLLGCFPAAFVAIILGHIARGQIRRNPEQFDGIGMATAGLVMGYAVLALMVFAGIVGLMIVLSVARS